MITTEKQLRNALKHYTQQSTINQTILSAVQRGVTRRRHFVGVAIEELIKQRRFGEAAEFAKMIGQTRRADALLETQAQQDERSRSAQDQKQKEFNNLLSTITSKSERRTMILQAVERGVTTKRRHVITALRARELIGPSTFPSSLGLAKKAGLNSADCEYEGLFGISAYMIETSTEWVRHDDATSIRDKIVRKRYSRYAKTLERNGRYGLAADIHFRKLDDMDSAIRNYKKAGMWEMVVELYRLKGEGFEQEIRDATKMMKMLRS